MSEPSLIGVFTVPGYRKGPSVLGLVTIGVLFLVPGLVAPVGVLQLVGVMWLLAAAASAARDIAHHRAATTIAATTAPSTSSTTGTTA